MDLLNNSNSASQNAAIANANNPVQVIQSHQTTMITTASSVSHPTNVQLPLQTPTSNLVVMATNVNDNSKQIINNLAREMMESTGLHTTSTASILAQPNLQNANLIVKQEYVHASMTCRTDESAARQTDEDSCHRIGTLVHSRLDFTTIRIKPPK